jgi:leader peptidase (prepilin peptidase)/N-methyltransferase
MEIFYVAYIGLLGLLIGSFLNVVIWRVPRGESVVRPGSHCPRCDNPLGARDNVPVVSWLLLKRRCRHCGNPISARYPAVELLTAALFASVAARFGLDAVVPAYLYLVAVSVALALIDLDLHRLPDALTLPSYVVAPVLLGGAALVDGSRTPFLRSLGGMAAMYAVYLLMCLASPRAMGFGDVKLSGVLGAYTGWLGWHIWAVGLLGGFLSGGLFGVVLLATGRGGRKTKVPFGPFMIFGALLAVFAGEAIADVWLGT